MNKITHLFSIPQRLCRCPFVVYFYALYRPLGRVMSVHFLMVRKRGSLEGVGGLESLARGCRGWAESPNHQWRGTKWSVGPGECLEGRGWRALTGPRTGDLRLPAAGKDRQRARQADSLRGLGRDGP